MKRKVSDYIAEFLVENGIRDVFTVVGGGAMHMNDSFGHHSDLNCVYNHHEQASAMGAEGYFRVNNRLAAVCVTSGPGAINALNGVAGAYMDSIPMLVFSGQAATRFTVRYNNLPLRTFGGQEFDIVSALDKMVKYSEMLLDPYRIRYCLEKALYLATSGRPGPCWLDVPLDIQGAYVETDELKGYVPQDNCESGIREEDIRIILDKWQKAERPVIYAGNGIRIAGAQKELLALAQKMKVPVATCWNSIDLIRTNNPLYVGRGGIMGDRGGNFAVQNSDFLLCIGSRLNLYQIGYHVSSWAREAFIVDVDIDPHELEKPTLKLELPICADAKEFISHLIQKIDEKNKPDQTAWIEQCKKWKEQYPVVQKKHYEVQEKTNVYAFMDVLSKALPEKAVTVVANGSASVVGSQAYFIGEGQRFIMNCGMSSMGYDLPAAIGACVGNDYKEVICIAGDGSIQMNLQELQTIITNRLPIKIFVINNEGYHQIRQTQKNVFQSHFIGVGPASGDLGFPDFEKLSKAYEIPYIKIHNNKELEEKINEVLSAESYILCEVMCSTDQIFEPKSATRKREDGTLVSPPLEDLAPFLSREELKENMYIDLFDAE